MKNKKLTNEHLEFELNLHLVVEVDATWRSIQSLVFQPSDLIQQDQRARGLHAVPLNQSLRVRSREKRTFSLDARVNVIPKGQCKVLHAFTSLATLIHGERPHGARETHVHSLQEHYVSMYTKDLSPRHMAVSQCESLN